jgi:hypothetical protein
MKYARNILATGIKDESPLLLMFPQGEIRSLYTRPLHFEKGINYLTKGLEGKINILMTVVLVDYFSNQKPSLHYYLELFPFDKPPDVINLESSYNDFLNRSIKTQIESAPDSHHHMRES